MTGDDTRGGHVTHELYLRSCDCTVAVACGDTEIAALLIATFGALLRPTWSPVPDVAVHCRIDRAGDRDGFLIEAGGVEFRDVPDAGSLLLHVDKMLTLALQHHRSDLYFLHAASVSHGGRAVVLAAPPGTGKSTLTLALLQQGFGYLSDELAPIDVAALMVHPYPHALCLKSAPPPPCLAPPVMLGTGGRFHVPVASLPVETQMTPLPIAALVLLQRTGTPARVCERLSPASATAHVMANALNPLAHESDGLSAAARLATELPAYRLDTHDLRAACAAVADIMRRHVGDA